MQGSERSVQPLSAHRQTLSHLPGKAVCATMRPCSSVQRCHVCAILYIVICMCMHNVILYGHICMTGLDV